MAEKVHKLSWVIVGQELERIKKLEHNVGQCGTFMHIGSIPFYVKGYPKGLTYKNCFEIALCFNITQHDIYKMSIQVSCIIDEIGYIKTTTAYGNRKIILNAPPEWNQLKDLSCITINLGFKILSLSNKNYENIKDTEWNKYFNDLKYIKTFNGSLGKSDISALKKYKFKENKNSSHFYIGKIPFCIQLYPKGLYNENYSSLYLNCDAQGLNILKMDIWYQIKIPELGYTYIKTNEYYNFPKGFGISTNAIKSDELLSLNDFRIDITFQILSITNTDGNIIPHNNWHKYIRNTNDKKPTCIQPEIEPNIVSLKQEIILLKANNNALKGQIAYMKGTEINELKNENALLKERLMENDKQIITLKYEYDNQITNIMQKLKVLDTKYNALKQLIKKDNEVLLFLKSINMGLYYHLFCEQGFDSINDLKYITKDMLNDMGIIKMAHYSKILAGIKQYTINNANGETSSY